MASQRQADLQQSCSCALQVMKRQATKTFRWTRRTSLAGRMSSQTPLSLHSGSRQVSHPVHNPSSCVGLDMGWQHRDPAQITTLVLG